MADDYHRRMKPSLGNTINLGSKSNEYETMMACRILTRNKYFFEIIETRKLVYIF
jgi:hypothetical protein